MDWTDKQDSTMHFGEDSRSEDKTTAVITSLVEMINQINNHLGSHIDFSEAPITKKPTSKKVDIGTKNETDNSTLGNKSIVGMAISQSKPEVYKAINPFDNNSKDFTGSSLSKEDIDAVVEEAQQEFEAEKLAFGLGALAGRTAVGASMANDDEERKAEMSTSDAKALLSTLEEAAKALEKFMNTTRVASNKVMMPQDRKNELQ
tara:strand:- start:3241 stop:3852 length:612 start_codon:yes stop_codon:yes gene_type:complete